MIEESTAKKAQKQLYKAAKEIHLDPNLLKILDKPMRILKVSIPIKMDSGRVKVFTGYRCQYNNAKGPAKGGICKLCERYLQALYQAAGQPENLGDANRFRCTG